MFAPDVSKLIPHGISVEYADAVERSKLENILFAHHFNHSVIAVFPDTLHIPSNLKDIFTEDSNYYKLKNVPLYRFVEEKFIEAFVKRGKVTALSTNTLLDADNCACVTPTGALVLSIRKDFFVALGIEQYKPAVEIYKFQKHGHRYIVTINLKEECFMPGKKNYERVLNQLKQFNNMMNFLVLWEPDDPKICPSSIASYFKKTLRCRIEECVVSLKERREYNVKIPTFSNPSPELFEWLGLFCLGFVERDKNPTTEFLSSYKGPDDILEVGQVSVFQWSGLLLSSKLVKFFNILSEYTTNRSSLPWVCLHVQGFEDSPVTWNLQLHNYVMSGENHFTVIIEPSGSAKTCKMFTTAK